MPTYDAVDPKIDNPRVDSVHTQVVQNPRSDSEKYTPVIVTRVSDPDDGLYFDSITTSTVIHRTIDIGVDLTSVVLYRVLDTVATNVITGITTGVYVTLESEWNATGAVSNSADSTWNLMGAVTASFNIAWHVAEPAPDSTPVDANPMVSDWHVLEALENSISADWNLAGAVSTTLDSQWHVSTFLEVPVACTWHVSATVDLTSSMAWHALGITDKTGDLEWHVFTMLEDDISQNIEWHSYLAVSVSTISTWNVIDVIPVDTAPLVTQWHVLTIFDALDQAGTDIDFGWNVLEITDTASTSQWLVLKILDKSYTTRWMTLEILTLDHSFDWSALVRVFAESLTSEWYVLRALSQSGNFYWNVELIPAPFIENPDVDSDLLESLLEVDDSGSTMLLVPAALVDLSTLPQSAELELGGSNVSKT